MTERGSVCVLAVLVDMMINLFARKGLANYVAYEKCVETFVVWRPSWNTYLGTIPYRDIQIYYSKLCRRKSEYPSINIYYIILQLNNYLFHCYVTTNVYKKSTIRWKIVLYIINKVTSEAELKFSTLIRIDYVLSVQVVS
jgi:hypothetical protein